MTLRLDGKGQIVNDQRLYYTTLPLATKTRTRLTFQGGREWETVKFAIYIPIGALILACVVNVLHMVFRTKIEQVKTTVLLENIAGNVSCEDDTEMTSPFRLDIITL